MINGYREGSLKLIEPINSFTALNLLHQKIELNLVEAHSNMSINRETLDLSASNEFKIQISPSSSQGVDISYHPDEEDQAIPISELMESLIEIGAGTRMTINDLGLILPNKFNPHEETMYTSHITQNDLDSIETSDYFSIQMSKLPIYSQAYRVKRYRKYGLVKIKEYLQNTLSKNRYRQVKPYLQHNRSILQANIISGDGECQELSPAGRDYLSEQLSSEIFTLDTGAPVKEITMSLNGHHNRMAYVHEMGKGEGRCLPW